MQISDRIIDLRNQGFSLRDIAEKVGVTKHSVESVLAKNNAQKAEKSEVQKPEPINGKPAWQYSEEYYHKFKKRYETEACNTIFTYTMCFATLFQKRVNSLFWVYQCVNFIFHINEDHIGTLPLIEGKSRIRFEHTELYYAHIKFFHFVKWLCDVLKSNDKNELEFCLDETGIECFSIDDINSENFYKPIDELKKKVQIWWEINDGKLQFFSTSDQSRAILKNKFIFPEPCEFNHELTQTLEW